MEIYFKYLIYFFCFFPFLLPLKVLGTDIQFYAFIVSIAYLSCLSKWYYSKEIKLFCLYFFIAAIIGILSAPNIIIMVRCLFQYASLFFICCAVYNLLIRENGLDIRLSKYFILCWFIVGFVCESLGRVVSDLRAGVQVYETAYPAFPAGRGVIAKQ